MGATNAVRSHPDGVVIDAWVVPRAGRNEVAGIHDGALRVRVTAPPSGGQANVAVARVLAKAVGGHAGMVVSGGASRRKKVLVRGVTIAAAQRYVRELASRR